MDDRYISDILMPPLTEGEEKGNSHQKVSSNVESSKDRAYRFAEITEKKTMMFKSMRPYYCGPSVNTRMDKIRESLIYIRHKWSEYDSFMATLKKLMEENGMQFENPVVMRLADSLFRSKKCWKNADDEVGDDNFDAIRLYTSAEGYNQIYRFINCIFREEDSPISEERIRSAMFLIELINIDLFNYLKKYPHRRNFQGVVYRGMGLSVEDFDAFVSLRKQPVANRFISILHGVMSTSSDLSIARLFIEKQLESNPLLDIRPLILKIHVTEMKPEFLSLYRQKFPTAVVSTIAAVDIKELSFYNESEVLLRGPFFQVLDLYESEQITGKVCHMLEMVMLSSNRDHISTAFLGSKDGLAREIIRKMASISQKEFALAYCKGKGYREEAEEYQRHLDEDERTLKELLEKDAL